MIREIAFGLFFISIILKTIGLFKANDQSKSLEERKNGYRKFNIPGNLLIVAGVLLLLFTKFFT